MPQIEEMKKMDVKFEITEEHLDTGLRGIPIGYCPTSHVDPQKGLFYHNMAVADIGSWTPEETVFFLMTGRKGSKTEVEKFSLALESRAKVPGFIEKLLGDLPKGLHPMQCLVSLLAALPSKNDYTQDALDLIAMLPELTATLINTRAGWGKGEKSNPHLGMIENFVNMLNIPKSTPGLGDKKALTEVMKQFHKLHLDHGGGNLSTFIGKGVASGAANLYLSLAGAMAALAGPKHGGANQDCLNFVRECCDSLKGNLKPAAVRAFIENKLKNNELIYGFGHAVLRVEDPRATVFYGMGQKMFPNNDLVKAALMIRTEGSEVLKQNPKIADPYPNVDAMSGTLLTAAGFDKSEFYTVLFGMSRMIGIAMQIIFEREHARNGKGVPIYRPKYMYKALSKSIIDESSLS